MKTFFASHRLIYHIYLHWLNYEKKGGVGKSSLIIRDYDYLRIYLDGCEKEISTYKTLLSLNRLSSRKTAPVWITCKHSLDFYPHSYTVSNDEKI